MTEAERREIEAVWLTRIAAVERFWSKVDKTPTCWWWNGKVESNGYGRFALTHTQQVGAHRFSYTISNGEIPESLQIDHLCRNPLCVNPAHLDAVDARTNVLRGNTLAKRNSLKSSCLRGHPFTLENTYLYRDKRHCRECRRSLKRKYKERVL